MNKKGNVLIGILMLIISITATAAITYNVFIKPKDNTNNPQISENNNESDKIENNLNNIETENNDSQEEIVDEETNNEEINNDEVVSENYNEIIDAKLRKPLELVLENEMGYDYSKINTVRNYLNTTENRITFAWQLMVQDNNISKIKDINVNNEEISGSLAIKTSDFINRYKEIYNQNIFESEIIQNGYTIKNDYIFGSYVTGWGAPNFVLKYKDFKYTGETNIYVLEIDFLTKIVNNKIDNEAILPYSDPNVVQYPENLIYKKLEVYLTKENDKYAFRYIMFEE